MATAAITYLFDPNTLAESGEVNTNFADLVAFLNGQTIHKDASIAFTGVPSGPATDPTSDNHFARKAYVDRRKIVTQLSATSNLPLTADGTVFSATGVPVVAGQTYAIHFHASWGVTAACRWDFKAEVNDVAIGRVGTINTTSGDAGQIDATAYWTAVGSSAKFAVVADEFSGSATLTVEGSAFNPRYMTVIGWG